MYNNNIYPGRFELDYDMIKSDIYNKIINKIFDYDYSPNTSELLKDSAAASDLDQWFIIPY